MNSPGHSKETASIKSTSDIPVAADSDFLLLILHDLSLASDCFCPPISPFLHWYHPVRLLANLQVKVIPYHIRCAPTLCPGALTFHHLFHLATTFSLNSTSIFTVLLMIVSFYISNNLRSSCFSLFLRFCQDFFFQVFWMYILLNEVILFKAKTEIIKR